MEPIGGCPVDFSLDSVLCRLRRWGREVRSLIDYNKAQTLITGMATPGVPAPYARPSARKGATYTEAQYEVDKAVLRLAIIAGARSLGDSSIAQLRGLAAGFSRQYLSGPTAATETEDLVRAVRNWLPYVSRAGFVPFSDDLAPREGMSEVPYMQPMPEQTEQSHEPPTQAEPPPEPPLLMSGPLELDRHETELLENHDKYGLLLARILYVPWRSLERTEPAWDPRLIVLAQSGLVSDDALRESLYSRHPILLVIQFLAPPRDKEHPVPPKRLAEILALPPPARRAGIQQIVTLCVHHCRQTAEKLFNNLDGETDWSRFRPLLAGSAEIITKREAPGSHVIRLCEELVCEISWTWTKADTLTAAAVSVALALMIASFFVSGPFAILLTIADVSLQTAAVRIHEDFIKAENQTRAELNSLIYIDQALELAGGPESSELGWWLGLVGLLSLPSLGVSLAQRGVVFFEGRALGAARVKRNALDAAQAASRKLPADQVKKVHTSATEVKPKSNTGAGSTETAPASAPRVAPKASEPVQPTPPKKHTEEDFSDLSEPDTGAPAGREGTLSDPTEPARAVAFKEYIQNPLQKNEPLSFQRGLLDRYGDPSNIHRLQTITRADGVTVIDDLARQAGLTDAQRNSLLQLTKKTIANAEIKREGLAQPVRLATFWQRAIERSEAAASSMAKAAMAEKQAEEAYLKALALQARMKTDPITDTLANRELLERLRTAGKELHETAKVEASKAYNYVRALFWREIHETPGLVLAIERDTGLVFARKDGRPTGAPALLLGKNRKEALTLEHLVRKSDDPRLALDPENLQLLPSWANSTFNELFRLVDPFSKGLDAARWAERAVPAESNRLVNAIDNAASRGLTPNP